MISNVNNALQAYQSRSEKAQSLSDQENVSARADRKVRSTSEFGDSIHLTHTAASAALKKAELLLPFERNVQELSTELSTSLVSFYHAQGIEPDPAMDFTIDVTSGKIETNSNRPDAQETVERMNQDGDLQQLMQTVNAIASHAYTIPAHLRNHQEYRSAGRLEGVGSNYDGLFGAGQRPELSYRFDGSRVTVRAGDQTWLTSR